MDGLVCAFQGHIGRDAELRYLSTGKALVSASVVVSDSKRKEDQPVQWVKVTLFGDAAEDLAPKLVKGTEVYAEGRLKLNSWQAQDGSSRSGLELVAWKLEPLGQIGRRRPPTPIGNRGSSEIIAPLEAGG